MMEYRRLSGTIADNREKEGLKADVERQGGNIGIYRPGC